ncbi:metallophosphoesterase domain-containing protein 1 [Sparassis latifolia]|uniref:Metallophosphoesterase domain-containing protein n=1 Tax=Sparassis crispa TaxID=139825 RepID=A0A401G8V0_9APHY|nr:metallophosphoesterase domain-containing protein [Sparassis crispa]GBE78591.1 metallophosphoesterase domain-containing protein [Sparassis crispa]
MNGLDSLLNRRPSTVWEQFWFSPAIFLARWAYARCQEAYAATRSNADAIRVVCISDTHNAHPSLPELPPGDILIHAGDLTQSGTLEELSEALNWLSIQPHPHKIFIAGNHDSALAEPAFRDAALSAHPDLIYLDKSSVSLTVRGRDLIVYGSPDTPCHGSWPFQYPRVPASQARSSSVWSEMPIQTDVLITHGPPAFHLDMGGSGCMALLHAVWRVRPRLHVFGHIHGGRGIEYAHWTQAQMAFEAICSTRGVWWSMLTLVWETLRSALGRQIGNQVTHGGTVMVNAAAVGGLRDEKLRGAIVVEI